MLTNNKEQSVTVFLKWNIFQKFCMPRTIISAKDSHFCIRLFHALVDKYSAKYRAENPHHTQTSGLVVVSNQNIQIILVTILNAYRTDWSSKFSNALRSCQKFFKTSIGTSTYHLVCGKSYHLLVHLELNPMQALKKPNLNQGDAYNFIHY